MQVRRVRWPGIRWIAAMRRIYLESFKPEDRTRFTFLVAGILVGKLRLCRAEESGLVSGFALWAALPAPAADTAYLAYLAVSAGRRGGGIGGALFDATDAWAAQDGYLALVWEIEVPGENGSLTRRRLDFYIRSGGRLVKTADRYAERTSLGTEKPMRLMWRPLRAGALEEEDLDRVTRWIQAIYRLAYGRRMTERDVQDRFMTP